MRDPPPHPLTMKKKKPQVEKYQKDLNVRRYTETLNAKDGVFRWITNQRLWKLIKNDAFVLILEHAC